MTSRAYKVVYGNLVDGQHWGNAITELNQLGQQGWRIIACTAAYLDSRYVVWTLERTALDPVR